MGFYLGALISSFLLHAVALVPFINLLYSMRFQRQKQKTLDAFNVPTPIFDAFNKAKSGTPLGGGLLIILLTSFIFFLSIPVLYYFWIPMTSIYNNHVGVLKVLFFTFLSFGFIGAYDDIKKIFVPKSDQFFGLRLRHKLILELILSFIAAFWLFFELKISFINIPFMGQLDLGLLYIPFAALMITTFANAFNITDGLDGLASGILMIALVAFWVISHSILDTSLTLFIAIWLGGMIAFLYFNIYPARIIMGDVGSLSFGATLAIIGLLLGKSFTLFIIGGVYLAEILSSFLQLMSKKYRGKKLMPVAPLHLWLQHRGWHETTIVFRAWLASIMLAIVGLWLAFIY